MPTRLRWPIRWAGPQLGTSTGRASSRTDRAPSPTGEAQLEVIHVHAWDETAVLVAVERQHGEVGNLPEQDWSLRITLIFRRAGGTGSSSTGTPDPLVHPIDLNRLAALARGE
jgi:hypothetical protein